MGGDADVYHIGYDKGYEKLEAGLQTLEKRCHDGPETVFFKIR